jgi:hypothetical protein
MAQYKVLDPQGNVRLLEGPDGATDQEVLAQAQRAFSQPDIQPDAPQRASGTDIAKAAGTGALSVIPQILGMPADLLRDVANFGIAGYGIAKHELTGSRELPDPIGPLPGGFESIKKGIAEAYGVDPFSNPAPNDPAARMAHTGANILASGGRRALSMLPAAIGGAVGEEVSGTAGAVAGTTLPLLARGRGAKPSVDPEQVATARKAGYVVPPSSVSPTLGNRLLESIAGKTDTEQSAIVRNQPRTNAIITKDLGLPEGTPLTDKLLAAERAKSGAAYQAVKQSGVSINATDAYIDGVANLGREFSAAAKEFPELLKNDKLNQLQDSLMRSSMSAGGAVELSRYLRQEAGANLKSFDDSSKMALGRAQKQAAGLVENLVRDNLAASGKGALVDAWDAARTRIAKLHDAESALTTGGNIDAKVYARLADKDRPLTGGAATVADFAGTFPKVARTPESIGSPDVNARMLLHRALGGGVGGAIGAVVGGPVGAAIGGTVPFVAPAAARGTILSGPYQNALAARANRPRRFNALAPYVASESDQ